ncbi:predicted protein [Uncinocarpus reesii 1704]|uniref:Uncharacterized protein n=1 Tax=Uncinocarpus reesii (strain UAMH 1704) TaxID=336963 RepID=C4JWG2_UNCRE|nr:uncharacterized protein UREG_06904 [Uncinocarpus reesii 1704]EEP82039.1 predicted protein [Uncinocarpus reesii 1704]
MSNTDAPPLQPQQLQQSEGQPKWYRVLQPQMDTAAHDPLDPAKRYHEGVFVEANPEKLRGTLFHVTGDIIGAHGMRYEERINYCPADSIHLHVNPQIGWVLSADFHSGKISTILRSLPTPPKQQGINFWEVDPVTKRHEIIWTKENGDPYGPDEQQRPVFKCNEWTNLYAVPALRDAGVLHDLA